MTGKSHRTIGYLRVSTGTQDLNNTNGLIIITLFDLCK